MSRWARHDAPRDVPARAGAWLTGASPTSSRRGVPLTAGSARTRHRLFKHHQFQVVLKPAPDEVQNLYLESLEACGINPRQSDIRFEEDNWESPTLGAWGMAGR